MEWTGKRSIKNSQVVSKRLSKIGGILEAEKPFSPTLILLEEWYNIQRRNVKLYKKLATECMNESYFRFRDKLCKSTSR